jgi:hypothetical protein
MRTLILLPLLAAAGCTLQTPVNSNVTEPQLTPSLSVTSFEENTWQHFLQHLPTHEGAILEYTGKPAANQQKHSAIVSYDVGNRDLQQCADALMRIRAEYLFARGRFDDIQFHFTSGDLYRYKDYCSGLRPVPEGNKVRFINETASGISYKSLKKYLEIVYTYAGTFSLAKELKRAKDFSVGTVIIKPGSPGHCFIIIDEAVNEKGEKLFKLAEGFTPAQSIYILKNLQSGSSWYRLEKGSPIQTASYSFSTYSLCVFE